MKHIRDYATQAGSLMEEIKERQELLAEVFAEAKSDGITVSALRKAVKIHFMPADKREKYDSEQSDLILYLDELNRVETDPMQRIKEAVS